MCARHAYPAYLPVVPVECALIRHELACKHVAKLAHAHLLANLELRKIDGLDAVRKERDRLDYGVGAADLRE